MLEFIAANWIKWLFAGITALLGYLYRRIELTMKAEQKKNEAIAAGVQALLRESIVSAYNRYSEMGYCPIYAKESLRRMYTAYHGLEGNDVATKLYNTLLAMPEEPEKEKDNAKQ